MLIAEVDAVDAQEVMEMMTVKHVHTPVATRYQEAYSHHKQQVNPP